MSGLESRKILHKVAKAYYEDALTQEKIGQRFGLSRIRVSRLLRQARDERIVQISIVAPDDGRVDLERAIEARYGLDEALIADPTDGHPASMLAALGEAAAACVMRTLHGEETVALSWGNHLLATVDALKGATAMPIRDWAAMRVVQSLGGLGDPEAEVYGAGLTNRLAHTLGAKAHLLSAPGIVANPAVCQALRADAQIGRTLALAARADIALMGIGALRYPSVGTQTNTLTAEVFAELQELGAIGDIGLRFFDAEGRTIDHEVNGRIVGLTLKQLKGIPRVLGVAGGPGKYEVVRAALRGNLLNVLVTDENTARCLLEEPDLDHRQLSAAGNIPSQERVNS